MKIILDLSFRALEIAYHPMLPMNLQAQVNQVIFDSQGNTSYSSKSGTFYFYILYFLKSQYF